MQISGIETRLSMSKIIIINTLFTERIYLVLLSRQFIEKCEKRLSVNIDNDNDD